jgi:hypothetical protein
MYEYRYDFVPQADVQVYLDQMSASYWRVLSFNRNRNAHLLDILLEREKAT